MLTGLTHEYHAVPQWLVGTLLLMAGGVFLSGVRELYAAYELPYGNWPWPKSERAC